MNKTNNQKKQIFKRSITPVLAGIFVSFLISYSLLTHLFYWYERTLMVKLLSIICGTILLAFIILFLYKRFKAPINETYHKKPWSIICITVLIALIIGVYFIFYYEPIPFVTNHQLKIQNVSEDGIDGEWKPVEITKITYLNGDPIPVEELEFSGEYWVSDNKILLKPSSTIEFSDVFKGGINISLRTNDSQGTAFVDWDGDIQTIDLSSVDESQTKISFSASSWGVPGFTAGAFAVISVIADFISAFMIVWFLTLLIYVNYSQEGKETRKKNHHLEFNWIDIVLCVVFLGLSVVLTRNIFGGHFMSYTNLSGDAGNYASFAAAKTYPQLFQNDPLLNDQNNFDYYFTYHIYLTKLLAPILGNFGSAFMFLQFPLTFMQLFGFYLLGKELYQNRLFGVMLTSVSFIFIQMNLSEFWGYVTSPIPRMSFQAILPFILYFVLKQGNNVKKWPAIMAVIAASTYVHAVSAPAWSIAIAISLLVLAPRSVSAKEKKKYILIALLVYLIVLAPFVKQYFEKTTFGEQDIYSLEMIYEIIDYRLSSGMADFKIATGDFINNVLLKDEISTIFSVVSLFSIALMNSLVMNESEKKRVLAVSMWAIGIFLISIIFPMFDFTIADLLGRNPLQIQFLRAMRNFFPILYIFILWPLSYIYNNLQKEKKYSHFLRMILAVISISFVWLWATNNDFFQTPVVARTINCWEKGQVICDDDEKLAERAVFFKAIEEKTPEGSRILSDDLAVRYYSLRPMAFSKKDGATFSFSNHDALIKWYQYAKIYDNIWLLKEDVNEYINAYTDFAHLVEADYLVFEHGSAENIDYPSELELVFSTNGYSLFSVQ